MVVLTKMTTLLAHEIFKDFKNDVSLFSDPKDYKEYFYSVEKIDSYVMLQNSKGRILYAILYNNIPVGEIRLSNVKKDECEIGIVIKNDKYKNKGIGTKALQEALRIINYSLIYASILKTNSRSQHVFSKIGFEKVCECDKFYIYQYIK